MQLEWEEESAFSSEEIVEAVQYAVTLAGNDWVPCDLRVAVFQAGVSMYSEKVKTLKIPEALRAMIQVP